MSTIAKTGISTKGGTVHLNVSFNEAKRLVGASLGKEYRAMRWTDPYPQQHVKFGRRVGTTTILEFQAAYDPYEKRLSIHEKAFEDYDVYDIPIIFKGAYLLCNTLSEVMDYAVRDRMDLVWMGNINHHFPV